MVATEAIQAIHVEPGDCIRCPEATSAFTIKAVRFTLSDDGAWLVLLDAGWGTCELAWCEFVDRVLS